MRRFISLLVGVSAGLALVLGGMTAGWFLPEEEDPHLIATPFPAAPLSLVTHHGGRFQLEPSDQMTVVFFGYTHCPDICPLTLAKLTDVAGRLALEGGRLRVLFVTVDPQRDTVERLADYMGAFDADFLGLTGPEESIAEVARGWGVFRNVPRAGGEDYVVDHTARSFIVDGDLMIRGSLPPEAAVTSIVETLNNLSVERD